MSATPQPPRAAGRRRPTAARSRSPTATNMAATSASPASRRARPPAAGRRRRRPGRATFSNNESAGVDWGWSGRPTRSGTNRTLPAPLCRDRHAPTTVAAIATRRPAGSTQRESIDVSQYKTGHAVDQRSATPTDDGDVPTAGGSYDTRRARRRRRPASTRPPSPGTAASRSARRVNTITRASGLHDPERTPTTSTSTCIPNNDDTRWRPMCPQLSYRRTAGIDHGAPARRWQRAPARPRRGGCRPGPAATCRPTSTRCTPTGNTYHDIGMIWGARMISNGGIFADSPDTFNGMPVVAPHHLHDRRPDGHRQRHLRAATASSRTTSGSAACRARPRPSSTAATCSASR